MTDRTHTAAEIAEAEAKLAEMKATPVKKFADMTEAEQRAFERSIGVTRPWSATKSHRNQNR